MKFIFEKDNKEEYVLVHAKEKNKLIDKIEELVNNDELKIEGFNYYGYLEDDIVKIKLNDVTRFIVEGEKAFAILDDKKYQIKARLYQIEEQLPLNFIRINKSCIVNIDKINRFNSSFTGSLLVEMKNGDIDYVSRRLVKNIKERMGI